MPQISQNHEATDLPSEPQFCSLFSVNFSIFHFFKNPCRFCFQDISLFLPSKWNPSRRTVNGRKKKQTGQGPRDIDSHLDKFPGVLFYVLYVPDQA
jgi:hypothetical protein